MFNLKADYTFMSIFFCGTDIGYIVGGRVCFTFGRGCLLDTILFQEFKHKIFSGAMIARTH